MNAMNAFCFIPLDEESEKPIIAFQTNEGLLDSLWARCRPASQIQRIAFQTAMEKHIPLEYRHKIALYADDMAARANTLEEIFEIHKALFTTPAKAGIHIKSSKVEFGVEEIIFHNYKSKRTEGLELGAVDKLLVGILAGRDEGEKDFPNSPCPPLFFSLRYPIIIIMILLDQSNHYKFFG